MQYFIVMIDYGRRGREAIVDPEITRREVVSRVASGEYKNISFNAKPINGVKLDWIGEICLTLPRGQIARMRSKTARSRKGAKSK